MTRSRTLLRRLAGVAFVVVLLGPLVAAAHVHGLGGDVSPGCGVCTVAKHAPAAVAPAALVAGITHGVPASVAAPLAPSCAGRCRRPAGRAPPPATSRPLT